MYSYMSAFLEVKKEVTNFITTNLPTTRLKVVVFLVLLLALTYKC